MVHINSEDYHDFVIKNGKLIGEFEQMYKKSSEIPWHQDKQLDWLDVKLTMDLLQEYLPFDYICDFGCGLGFFLDILRTYVASPKCELVGYDVSPTCCEKAKKIFPDVEFHVLDLMKDSKQTGKKKKSKEKRLFVIRGTLWYVFPKMSNVVKNIKELTNKDDFLLISQNFPPLRSDFVGKEVIANSADIVKWFSDNFSPARTIWLEDWFSGGNDNWFIGLFTRSEK